MFILILTLMMMLMVMMMMTLLMMMLLVNTMTMLMVRQSDGRNVADAVDNKHSHLVDGRLAAFLPRGIVSVIKELCQARWEVVLAVAGEIHTVIFVLCERVTWMNIFRHVLSIM
jgi:hypothetical protein